MSTNPKGIPLLEVGRDVNGRFRPGNQGGPGNPFARKVAALRKALLDSVSEQDLKDMVEVLKQQARQGDKAAIKLILQYCVGKPAPPEDPDRMDADEWDRFQQMSVGHQQFWKTMETIPACLACHIAAAAWPSEVQDGPLAETVQYVHSQLGVESQPVTQPSNPSQNTPDRARPEAPPVPPRAAADQTGESDAPTEPTFPTAECPSSAKGERTGDRREPPVRSTCDSHSPSQLPSPNGGNEEAQRQALEQLRRLRQQSQPSGQTEREPPPG